MTSNLRLRRLAVIAAAMAVLLSASALAGEAPAEPDATHAEDGEEGEKAATRAHPMELGYNAFTDIARGGYGLYERHCSTCHGRLGEDHDHKGALLETGLFENYRQSQDFHARFRDTHETDGAPAGKIGWGRASFNNLEMIGKYLRELRLWLEEHPDTSEASSG